MDKIIIGIDSGGSTTKIVGLKEKDGEKILIEPIFVKATDQLTSAFGAFGKFLDANGLSLEDIERVMITGAGSSYITKPIYGLDCYKINEFKAIGLGGLFLSKIKNALITSLGTGTSIVHAVKGKDPVYLGGTGVGGGTLLGLAKSMIGMDTIEHIEELAKEGDLGKVDLKIGDIIRRNDIPGFTDKTTASNFGKISDIANKNDIALGIINMVFETIGMVSVFAARGCGVNDIVIIGNLSSMEVGKKILDNMSSMFGVNFIIPEYSRFGTVIGAALADNFNEDLIR